MILFGSKQINVLTKACSKAYAQLLILLLSWLQTIGALHFHSPDAVKSKLKYDRIKSNNMN